MITQSSGMEGAAFILALIVLVVGVAWVVFPFIVIGKFNKLIDVQREILKTLRESRTKDTKDTTPPPLPTKKEEPYRL